MDDYGQKYKALIHLRKTHVLKKQAGLTETHHIKLASLWPSLANDVNNLVELTIYEHVLAHKYLYLWYKEKYGELDNRYHTAAKAYYFMTTSRDGIQLDVNEAAKLRKDYSKACSFTRKGKPISEKNKQKIIEKWRTDEMRLQQSVRIRKAYADKNVGAKITKANQLRYSDLNEREKTRQKSLEFFRTHPEAALKHSADLKGRKYIYNVQTKKFKMIFEKDLDKWLKLGWTLGIMIYKQILRGKNKGQIIQKYICPWKIDQYIKPNDNKKCAWSTNKPI